jgi:hypothetical protein
VSAGSSGADSVTDGVSTGAETGTAVGSGLCAAPNKSCPEEGLPVQEMKDAKVKSNAKAQQNVFRITFLPIMPYYTTLFCICPPYKKPRDLSPGLFV